MCIRDSINAEYGEPLPGESCRERVGSMATTTPRRIRTCAQVRSPVVAEAAAQLHQTGYEMDKVAEEFFDAGAPCVDMAETVPFGGDCDSVDWVAESDHTSHGQDGDHETDDEQGFRSCLPLSPTSAEDHFSDEDPFAQPQPCSNESESVESGGTMAHLAAQLHQTAYEMNLVDEHVLAASSDDVSDDDEPSSPTLEGYEPIQTHHQADCCFSSPKGRPPPDYCEDFSIDPFAPEPELLVPGPSPDHGPSQSSSPDHGPSQSSSPDHGPSQSFENEPSLPGDYQEILPNPTLEDYCIAGGLTPRSRRSTPHSTQAGSSMLVDKRILDVESVAAALNELNVSRQESPNMMQEPSSEIARAAAQLHQTVYEMDKVAEEFFDAGAPCVDMPETVPFGGDCDPVDDD
eukprot:TRINITY_DN3015_c0_g1_i7.p1 TRINITY_DN3015_c0_g1~~TRINITY_DN3015_c0_g1_i7.p1  ORF type:complete len:403 (+),score=65.73 TRINITY_DN3015_c0_g1_i7:129-1337(+)